MNLSNVAEMQHLYLPLLLTSLILGMVILILLEKRKKSKEEERVQEAASRNTKLENRDALNEEKERNTPLQNTKLENEEREWNTPLQNTKLDNEERERNTPLQNTKLENEEREQNTPLQNTKLGNEEREQNTKLEDEEREQNTPLQNTKLENEEKEQNTPLQNTNAMTDNKEQNTPLTKITEEDLNDTVPETPKVEDATEERNTEDVLLVRKASTSSCSSSSGSEEEAVRAVKVLSSSRRPRKKHACKGSVITCATKRKVTAVTLVTDSLEEEVQVSLEDLAGEIRSRGVTCCVHPASTRLLPTLSTEPSHLLLLFGTTSKGCEGLQGSLRTALGGDAALPTPQPFLYSVTCWSEAAEGEVYQSARQLSASLGSCGGAEWLPVTCITTAAEGEGEAQSDPPVMARRHYVNTVIDKITKPGKKCCGSSCGSKTVDIEDLVASLLPVT